MKTRGDLEQEKLALHSSLFNLAIKFGKKTRVEHRETMVIVDIDVSEDRLMQGVFDILDAQPTHIGVSKRVWNQIFE